MQNFDSSTNLQDNSTRLEKARGVNSGSLDLNLNAAFSEQEQEIIMRWFRQQSDLRQSSMINNTHQ